MRKNQNQKPQAVKKLEELGKEVLINMHLGKLDESFLKEFDGSITRFLAYVKSQERKKK